MGVLTHKERFEAARFDRARQLTDIDAVVGRKVENADEHGNPSLEFNAPGRSIEALEPIIALARLISCVRFLCRYWMRHGARLLPPRTGYPSSSSVRYERR